MKKPFKPLMLLLAAVVLLAGCSKKSSEKKILSFSFYSPAVEAEVLESAKTIVATLPAETDLTALVPIITVSDKATVNPASGIPQDFTHSKTYIVTAEDGTQAVYTVTVTVENGGGNGGGNNGGGNGGGGDNGEETECTISLVPSPYTGGTVSGDGTYQNGQSCTITATPAAGYAFEKWERVVVPDNENDPITYVEVSTEATYTFTVTSSGIYYARFVEDDSYTITVSAYRAEGGTVSGGGDFALGQSCTITAAPAAGFTFVKWEKLDGTCVSTDASYTFTVTESAGYVAYFSGYYNTDITVITDRCSARCMYYVPEDMNLNWMYPDSGYLVVIVDECDDLDMDMCFIDHVLDENGNRLASFYMGFEGGKQYYRLEDPPYSGTIELTWECL